MAFLLPVLDGPDRSGVFRFTAGKVKSRHQIPVIYRDLQGSPDRMPGGGRRHDDRHRGPGKTSLLHAWTDWPGQDRLITIV
jgi:hypothetical protein